MDITKIGIIGSHGMVGSQVRKWFEEKQKEGKCSLFLSDKGKKIGSIEEVNKADIIFVAVPTPYKENDEYDLSILEEVISQIKDGKVVVIKSTVNPGTTDKFQEKYPGKIFMFNPEFLTELTAWEDFIRPDMQVLGIAESGYEYASAIIQILPRAHVMRIVSLIDAEWVKKIRNAYYSMKVIFFNQIFDIVSKTSPADYETIRSIIVEDPRIGNSHSFIFHKGYRGFSGPCLPKDTYSLIEFAKRVEASSELLEVVKKINKELTEGKDFSYGTLGANVISNRT